MINVSQASSCHAKGLGQMIGCLQQAMGRYRGTGGEACLISAFIYEAPPMPQYEGCDEVQEQAGLPMLRAPPAASASLHVQHHALLQLHICH